MDTTKSTLDKPLLRGNRRQDLQDMLKEVGLADEYWLPKLQEHLGVTCAQAFQHLEEKDLQELKSQARYPWEERALQKLLSLSHTNSRSELQDSQVEMVKKNQKAAEQELQEIRNLQLKRGQIQEEEVKKRDVEMKQELEIPKEHWPPPKTALRGVLEKTPRQLNLMEGTLSHRQNFPDRDLVRWASGGLALQGIYIFSDRIHVHPDNREAGFQCNYLSQGCRLGI